MSCALLLGLALVAAAPSSAPTSESVLVLDLQPVGVSAEDTHVVDGLLATEIAAALRRRPADRQMSVHTADELRTLSDVEADRALVGCDGKNSCLAELAGAIGARYVVSGTLGQLGTEVVLQLNLVDTQTATTLGRGSLTRHAVADLAVGTAALVDTVLSPLVGDAVATEAGVPVAVVVGAVVGVLGVAAAGVGFGGLAVLDARLAPSSGAKPSEKQQAIDLAWPAVIVGAAGAVVAVGGGVAAGLSLVGGE